MKTLGNVVMIQRGETWSLDFDVTNLKGDPYMLFSEWKNPYLAITVTAARYEQKGDFRKTWWLDLNNRLVENENGTFSVVPMKRFGSTEALYIQFFDLSQVLMTYPQITVDGDKSKHSDVTNYLFFTDHSIDGNNTYKYVSNYNASVALYLLYDIWDSDGAYWVSDIVSHKGKYWCLVKNYDDEGNPTVHTEPGNSAHAHYENWVQLKLPPTQWYQGGYYDMGDIVNYNDELYLAKDLIFSSDIIPSNTTDWLKLYTEKETKFTNVVWEDYDFRVIKQFATKDWIEQNYLFDMKVLAGETIQEHIYGILVEQEEKFIPDLPWTDEQTNEQLKRITDRQIFKQMQEYFESGMPLMPDYETKTLVLEPTKLIVSANIQGGVR